MKAARARDRGRADPHRRRARAEADAADRAAGRALRRILRPLSLSGDRGPGTRHRRRDRRSGARAGRWTGWSAAMSASARPKWRCARPSSSAMSGEQVAVVVPTTLLARQHYRTFSERFAGFPVKIAQLSRFAPPRKRRRPRRGSPTGDVDIVIGTHALLAERHQLPQSRPRHRRRGAAFRRRATRNG